VKFKLPLTTLFLDWSNGFPVQKLVIQGYLPFVAVTSGFSWMSAVAHFFVLIFFSTYYIPDLRRGINRFRWIEYAFSSSLMIGLIAMLFGMYDVISLVLIMSVNATMNLFGFLMETSNVGKKTYDWTPFTFGGKCQRCMIPVSSGWCSTLGLHFRLHWWVWVEEHSDVCIRNLSRVLVHVQRLPH
jgi:Heliorhodopsin